MFNFIYQPAEDVDRNLNQRTPSPAGWMPYDGSIYTAQQGYGWLTNLGGYGRDRGLDGIVVGPGEARRSLRELNRLELANFQGTHPDNGLLVFRVDLPDGWYRVSCASVDPHPLGGKPLVDQRTFKCRSHDIVFAGALYGAPLMARGQELVEGSAVVEATNGHLRIVVGDPAYAGWVWSHPGPLNKGWRRWWYDESRYAAGWYQILTRTVDPGFHALSLNSLKIERVEAPERTAGVVFRDYFDRDDNRDINAGVPQANQWIKRKWHPRAPDHLNVDLYKTAVRFAGPKVGWNVSGLIQKYSSPPNGIIRYSTRVSLFTGEGSQKHSGEQEAGIVMLAESTRADEYSSTFIGIRHVGRPAAPRGWIVYRVGDGGRNYRDQLQIPDAELPFEIAEGEYEIVVEHDVAKNILRRIRINGTDVTGRLPLNVRTQRLAQGLFGVRSAIHNSNPGVSVRQYFWYYRVEAIAETQAKDRAG